MTNDVTETLLNMRDKLIGLAQFFPSSVYVGLGGRFCGRFDGPDKFVEYCLKGQETQR